MTISGINPTSSCPGTSSLLYLPLRPSHREYLRSLPSHLIAHKGVDSGTFSTHPHASSLLLPLSDTYYLYLTPYSSLFSSAFRMQTQTQRSTNFTSSKQISMLPLRIPYCPTSCGTVLNTENQEMRQQSRNPRGYRRSSSHHARSCQGRSTEVSHPRTPSAALHLAIAIRYAIRSVLSCAHGGPLSLSAHMYFLRHPYTPRSYHAHAPSLPLFVVEMTVPYHLLTRLTPPDPLNICPDEEITDNHYTLISGEIHP
jgi:hypothetical protein